MGLGAVMLLVKPVFILIIVKSGGVGKKKVENKEGKGEEGEGDKRGFKKV